MSYQSTIWKTKKETVYYSSIIYPFIGSLSIHPSIIDRPFPLYLEFDSAVFREFLWCSGDCRREKNP